MNLIVYATASLSGVPELSFYDATWNLTAEKLDDYGRYLRLTFKSPERRAYYTVNWHCYQSQRILDVHNPEGILTLEEWLPRIRSILPLLEWKVE